MTRPTPQDGEGLDRVPLDERIARAVLMCCCPDPVCTHQVSGLALSDARKMLAIAAPDISRDAYERGREDAAKELRAWAAEVERGNVYDEPEAFAVISSVRALADRWSKPDRTSGPA